MTNKDLENKPEYEQIQAEQYVSYCYQEYAKEVNGNRMIPSDTDGLKPIQKRLLLSFLDINQKNIQNMAVIGHCIRYYSPHSLGGGSIEPLVNCRYPLVKGIGSWGYRGLVTVDKSADRYLHCELSEFAEKQLKDLWKFSDFFLNENDYQEAVNLPLIFPNSLLNGVGTSMGVGCQTNYPQCTIESLKLALKDIMSGIPLDKIPVKHLVRPYSNGNITISDQALKDLNYKGTTRVVESAIIEECIDEKNRKYFKVRNIPDTINPRVVLDKMSKEIELGLIYVEDISEASDIVLKVGREFNIRQISDAQLKEKLEKLYKTTTSYSLMAVDNSTGNAHRIGALQLLKNSSDCCLKVYKRYLQSQVSSLDEKILFETVKERIRELTKIDDITPEIMIEDDQLKTLSGGKLTLELLKKFLGKSISTLISKKKDTSQMVIDLETIKSEIDNLNTSYLNYLGWIK